MLYYAKPMVKLEEHIIELHKNSRGRFQKILSLWASRIKFFIKLQVFLYFMTEVILVLCPILVYYAFNEKVLVMSAHIPKISADTTEGFILTNCYLLFCINLAAPILCAVDSYFLLCCFTGAAYMDLVQCKCKELSDKLIDPTQKLSEQEIGNMFTSILVAGKKADE